MTILDHTIDFLKAEWQQVIASKTFKALVTLEFMTISCFVQDVISGTQHLDKASLINYGLVQAGITVAFLLRHTLAGIELKLDGAVDPEVVKKIEDQAIKNLTAKMNPALAASVNQHIKDSD